MYASGNSVNPASALSGAVWFPTHRSAEMAQLSPAILAPVVLECAVKAVPLLHNIFLFVVYPGPNTMGFCS